MAKWKQKMERARRLHRPSLKDWERDGLHKIFPAYVASLSSSSQSQEGQQKQQEPQGNNNNNKNPAPSTSTRTSSSSSYRALLLPGVPHPPSLPLLLQAELLEPDFFHSTLEAKGIPCVIQNIPKVENWQANWDLESLEQMEFARNRYFKCGEDDDGKSIKIKMKHFLKYLHTNKDDSPLYIFDSAFEDDRKAKKILTDYQVPKYFRDDLFGLISEQRRPPYRWFLVGPERSGTTVHIDPLATSAWNTLLVGQKRWVLFPPHVPKHIAKGKGFVLDHEDDEAIHYFVTILPRIKQKALSIGNRGDFKDFACYEFTQYAGETVFIPNGWWHGVLNLTHTVGITQNYCSPRNFDQVWIKTRSGRKLMAAKWLNQLDTHYPHLAHRARALNERDGFVMRHNPALVKKQDELKAYRKATKQKQKQMLYLKAQEKKRAQEQKNHHQHGLRDEAWKDRNKDIDDEEHSGTATTVTTSQGMMSGSATTASAVSDTSSSSSSRSSRSSKGSNNNNKSSSSRHHHCEGGRVMIHQ